MDYFFLFKQIIFNSWKSRGTEIKFTAQFHLYCWGIIPMQPSNGTEILGIMFRLNVKKS